MTETLEQYLAKLSGRLRRELAKTLEREAQEFAAALRTRVAVRTGRLRESIEVKRGRNDLEYLVTAGGPLTTVPVREGASAEYDYAMAQEFGTVKQAAEPFFYSTWDARYAETARDIEKVIEEILK